MRRGFAWGIGKGMDSREAAREAVRRAFDQLGTGRPGLAIAFISQELQVEEAISGLVSMLGATPLWGVTTCMPFTINGEHSRSVVVGIFSGADIRVQTAIFPRETLINQELIHQFINSVQTSFDLSGFLIAADGVSPNINQLLPAIHQVHVPIGGCLGEGGYEAGSTIQIGGNIGAPGALAILSLGGRARLGVGMGYGWRDLGLLFHVTRVRGLTVQCLDEFPAAEAYAKVFGYQAKEWSLPPLSRLARMYPLGIEVFPGSADLVLRSPILVEEDGGVRMNAPVTEGQVAHLMVGDADSCLMGAKMAASRALKTLGGAQPIMAMVFVDLAWRQLLTTHTQDLILSLQSVLGDIPFLGTYTLGQIKYMVSESAARIYNQNILVAVIGTVI